MLAVHAVSFDFCSIIISIDDYRHKIHEVIQIIEEEDDIIGGDNFMQSPSEDLVSDEDSGDKTRSQSTICQAISYRLLLMQKFSKLMAPDGS